MLVHAKTETLISAILVAVPPLVSQKNPKPLEVLAPERVSIRGFPTALCNKPTTE